MKNAFLVTGLPRSRTAWLSCFFNYGNVACLHDVSGRVDSVEALVAEMVATKAEYVGLADCGIVAFHNEIKECFARVDYQVRTLAVRRPPVDCLRGFARATQTSSMAATRLFDYLTPKLSALCTGRRMADMVVNFHELDDLETLRCAWHEMTGCGETPFPEEHAKRMLAMKVEVLPEIMYKSARQTPKGLAQRLANELSGVLA